MGTDESRIESIECRSIVSGSEPKSSSLRSTSKGWIGLSVAILLGLMFIAALAFSFAKGVSDEKHRLAQIEDDWLGQVTLVQKKDLLPTPYTASVGSMNDDTLDETEKLQDGAAGGLTRANAIAILKLKGKMSNGQATQAFGLADRSGYVVLAANKSTTDIYRMRDGETPLNALNEDSVIEAECTVQGTLIDPVVKCRD